MEMNIVQVFLFVVMYCFMTSLALVEQNSNTVLIEFKEFDKVCPIFWSKIQNTYIKEFATNCNYTIMASVKNRELLQHKSICLLANTKLANICQNFVDQEIMLSSLLNASDEKSTCPIKVDKTNNLIHPVLINISKLLQNETLCNKICYDFNDFEKQCSVLIQIENYLKNFNVNSSKIVNNAFTTKLPLSNPRSELSYIEVQKNDLKFKEIIKQNSAEPNFKIFTQKENNETHANQDEQNPNYLDSKKELSDLQKKEKLNYKEKIISQFTKNLEDESDSFKFQPILSRSYENEKSEANAFIDNDLNVDNSESAFPKVKQDHINEMSRQNQVYSKEYFQAEDSHIFFYFLMFLSLLVLGYFAFHNKNKILAYALEGKSERRSRKRPNSTRYRKLESNLEEAIVANVPQTSSPSSSVVVY